MTFLSPVPTLVSEHWQLNLNRADTRFLDMYERHYSCREYKDGRERTQGVAPGQYIVLMTAALDALFVWQKSKFRHDDQVGVNCAVFRNERNVKGLSSLLIREAVVIAQDKWKGERLFTFVDASKIQSSNPGYCFKEAGWLPCGKSATGLYILEWLP